MTSNPISEANWGRLGQIWIFFSFFKGLFWKYNFLHIWRLPLMSTHLDWIEHICSDLLQGQLKPKLPFEFFSIGASELGPFGPELAPSPRPKGERWPRSGQSEYFIFNKWFIIYARLWLWDSQREQDSAKKRFMRKTEYLISSELFIAHH